MNIRRLLWVAGISLASASAFAHAFLERAEPRVGSRVPNAPAELKLWFAGPLEAAFSTAMVLDANGRRVDRADAHVDASDRAQLRVSLAPLAAGTYTVRWRVVSVDSHVVQGDFVFRVGG